MNNNKLYSLSCKCGYSVLIPENTRTELTDLQLNTLQQNWGKVDYKDELSKTTSRRIAHILQVWYRTLVIAQSKNNLLHSNTQKNLVFITLTLSSKQLTNDNDIKRNMLNRFIVTMARKYKMVNYLWKAEKQKNGNLHFHIMTDVFINKNELNYEWDKIQHGNNYLKSLPSKSKDYTSPSTRIEVVKTNDGISKYMSKYVGKTDENGRVEGRKWGCSKEVRELKDYQFPMDSEVNEVITQAVNSGKIDYRIGDFFVIFMQDFFFQLYNFTKYHKSNVNILYAGNYHNLYKESNVFKEPNAHVKETITK